MSQHIFVDLNAALPPYAQIRTQISSLISLGELPAGSKLPTVRALATDLGVASGTVARAYKELEADGLVTSRRRAGTVVNSVPATEEISDELIETVDKVWRLAHEQGIDELTVKALVQRRMTG